MGLAYTRAPKEISHLFPAKISEIVRHLMPCHLMLFGAFNLDSMVELHP